MKKFFLLLVILIVLIFVFVSCPGSNDNNGTATPTPGPTEGPTEGTPAPVREIIEDFESSTVDSPPEGNVTDYDCSTSCADNSGVVVDDILAAADGKYVVLMLDIFGEPASYGEDCTGYSYIQINHTFAQDGILYFDYYHEGYNPGPAPSFTLSFWQDFTGNISDPGAGEWTTNVHTEGIFQTYSEIITAGTKTLTWRIGKNTAPEYEDDLFIDNIIFEYQEE